MAKRDLSSLPRGGAGDQDGERLPVGDPTVLPLLGQMLEMERVDLPMSVEGRRFRASWAGSCSRALSYNVRGVDRSEPLEPSSLWRFEIGTQAHHIVQRAIKQFWSNAECELPVDLRPIGLDGAATADVVVFDKNNQPLEVIEIKSVNGFGFKQMATRDRGLTGPRHNYVLQGGLAAWALGAASVRVVVVSLENASQWHVERHGYHASDWAKYGAEWVFDVSEILPVLAAERDRIVDVLAAVDQGQQVGRVIPDPEIPSGAVVSDPVSGAWEQRGPDGTVVSIGKTWHCGYCDFQSRCVADG